MLSDEDEIVALLRAWQRGEVDEVCVLNTAERIEEASGVPGGVPKDDPRSPLFEVLCQLTIMHVQWVTPEDVPSMLVFLRTAPTNLRAAWADWERYMASVDWEGRRLQLWSNPFYSKAPLPKPKP